MDAGIGAARAPDRIIPSRATSQDDEDREEGCPDHCFPPVASPLGCCEERATLSPGKGGSPGPGAGRGRGIWPRWWIR